MDPFGPVYLSVNRACNRWDCSRSQLYRLLNRRLIKAKKNGPKLLVDVRSGDAYFAGLPDATFTTRASTNAEVAS